jgi:multiple antibiotic resistance protein
VSDALRIAIFVIIVVDPIAAAVGASALARRRPARDRGVVVGLGTAVAAVVLAAVALLAEPLLDALDISAGAAQLAAGIVVLLPALDLLFQGPAGRVRADDRAAAPRLACFPFAVPLLAGPAAVAAVAAWSAADGAGTALAAVLLGCLVVGVVAFSWKARTAGRRIRVLGGFAAVAAAVVAFDLVRDGVFAT